MKVVTSIMLGYHQEITLTTLSRFISVFMSLLIGFREMSWSEERKEYFPDFL